MSYGDPSYQRHWFCYLVGHAWAYDVQYLSLLGKRHGDGLDTLSGVSVSTRESCQRHGCGATRDLG
jgi:hypothetical protein